MRQPSNVGKDYVAFGEVIIDTEDDPRDPFSICAVLTVRQLKKLQRDIAAALEWYEANKK